MFRYKQKIIIMFYKLTHDVVNFLDNEKKEIFKIIKNFWIEHMVWDIMKFSFFLFLVLWICFQAYYDTSQSHLSYDDYMHIKKSTDELYYIIDTQEETLKIQHEKMKKMAESVSYYRQASKTIHPVTASIVFSLGIGAGIVIMSVMIVGHAMSS